MFKTAIFTCKTTPCYSHYCKVSIYKWWKRMRRTK